VREGRILYLFDKDEVVKIEQTGRKEDFEFVETLRFTHEFGYMPVFKMGGFVEKFQNGEFLYKSFFTDVLDSWDEALRRYSDHQVNMVLHLHPYEWEIADSECSVCKGTGQIKDRAPNGRMLTGSCHSCNGVGRNSVTTPFGRKLIKPVHTAGVGNSFQIPTPPAGIINRDIQSIGFLKQEYKDQIKEGLSSINMEFVMDEPELNSGVAKTVDREELYNFVGTFYEHVVNNILIPCYYFINAWRGGQEENLPLINVPKKFDLLTSDVISARVKVAKESKFSATIVNRLEIDYARKEFGE